MILVVAAAELTHPHVNDIVTVQNHYILAQQIILSEIEHFRHLRMSNINYILQNDIIHLQGKDFEGTHEMHQNYSADFTDSQSCSIHSR